MIATGFVAGRLEQARRARGLSATDLADLVGVSLQSISKYENGHQVPRFDTAEVIASQLRMPRSFFFRPMVGIGSDPVFWRARLSAPPVWRDRAGVRLSWFKEIVDYLSTFFDLTEVNLPEVESFDDRLVDTAAAEAAAAAIRAHWGIVDGPFPDAVEQLEINGVLVARIHVHAEKLDAFSQYAGERANPLVVLSRDKSSACRQRFDALHELAHLVVHRTLSGRRMNDKATYKIVEKQADLVAAALLLPAREFANDLVAPTLDGLLMLKERWGASVGAMIMRCRALGIIDDEEVRRLFINYNRRGWRGNEPLDARLPTEEPQLLRRSLEMLIEERVRTVEQILDDLPFPPGDIEEIAGLAPGTLTPVNRPGALPAFKEGVLPENVVRLFPPPGA